MKLTVSRAHELIAEINEDLPADLAPMLNVLQQEAESYFVFTRDNGQFLQGSWHPPDGYHLEYDEAPISDGFHRTPDLVAPEIAGKILNLFRCETPGWKELCEWETFDVGDPDTADSPASPDAADDMAEDAWMGNFDGVALRHVIKDLERNDIPCRLEPNGIGFEVYVPAEFYEQAHDLIVALFPP